MRRFRLAALSAAKLSLILGILLLPEVAAFAQCDPSGGSNSASGSGWVAGAQAGYNWQHGAWVYGLETDLLGTGLKTSMSGGLTNPCPSEKASTNAKIDWYGTLRLRAGWAVDRAVFYGTGGLAYGEVDLNSRYAWNGQSLISQTSSDKAGWVLGAGVDYMLKPNLFLNLGYEYVDLGTVNRIDPAPSLAQTASTHAAFNIVFVGLNLLFSPTGERSASTPWQGAYIGGEAGGAWGLNTDANYSPYNFVAPSDIRLKRDVVLVGHLADGLGLYRYRYIWGNTVYVGVIAQEVALLYPEAVVHDAFDDYLRVDYGRLGLKLMTLRQWKAARNGARL